MRASLQTTLLASALFALPLTAVPFAAQAASTVYGGGPAQACFEAALHGRTDPASLRDCDTAIMGNDLDTRDRAATMVNRGVIRLQRREAQMALSDFDNAIAWRPELGEAYVNRGAALIRLGDFDGAITSINRGLDLGSEDPQEAYFNRAVANEKLDNLPAAYADYRKALELKPDWALAQSELARFTVTSAR